MLDVAVAGLVTLIKAVFYAVLARQEAMIMTATYASSDVSNYQTKSMAIH